MFCVNVMLMMIGVLRPTTVISPPLPSCKVIPTISLYLTTRHDRDGMTCQTHTGDWSLSWKGLPLLLYIDANAAFLLSEDSCVKTSELKLADAAEVDTVVF